MDSTFCKRKESTFRTIVFSFLVFFNLGVVVRSHRHGAELANGAGGNIDDVYGLGRRRQRGGEEPRVEDDDLRGIMCMNLQY
jgi:hypothetical protein